VLAALPLRPDDVLPRQVRLAGCTNMRDLGGYQGHGGGRVRFGQVYRAASLAALTGDDLSTLDALGLRCVVDLRGEREGARAPSCLPDPAPELVALPVEPTVGASLRDIMATGRATGEDVTALLARAYTAYATEKLPRYRALLSLVANPARRPIVFHCTAGKDRTGFGAALLLLALGVAREAVMQDYVATDRLWRREVALPAGTPPEAAEALTRTHPELLDRALDLALAGHAPGDDGLAAALGMDAAGLAALREQLLE
jgi:protein-tyrosine phosphatase